LAKSLKWAGIPGTDFIVTLTQPLSKMPQIASFHWDLRIWDIITSILMIAGKQKKEETMVMLFQIQLSLPI